MVELLITCVIIVGVSYLASRIIPVPFKFVGRLGIAIPLGALFLFVLLALFDAIHHAVGLILHFALKSFLWLFYRYHFEFHLKDYLNRFWLSHCEKLITGIWRHRESGHLVRNVAVTWVSWVTIFFVQECRRVRFREASKTVLRDGVFLLDKLYRGLSQLIELSLGKFVRRSLRFVSDKQMQEAIKTAAHKAATDQLES